MWQYLKNGWNWVHLFGSSTLTILLCSLIPAGFAFAFMLGCLWEGSDELNKTFNWKVPFLDPNGADSRDILMDLIGVALGFYIWRLK